MRRLLLLLPLLATAAAGCDALDQRATMLPLEPGWTPEILLSEKDGIASPDGLLWADGSLFIADEGGSAVRRWVPGGKVETLADATSGLASPEDLARAADGTLYASDDTAGGIWRIGAGRAERVSGLGATEGLAVTPAGAPIAGEPGRDRIATGDGRTVSAGIAKPESLAWDGHGNLYVADNEDDRLYLLTPQGRLHRPIGQVRGFSPESLAFARGALWITDSAHGKLFRYTPRDGLTPVALLAGELANVQGIAADPQGNLYLSVQSDLEGRRGYVLRLRRAR